MTNEMRLNDAIEEIMQFIRGVNKYMEKNAPWKMVKEDKVSAGTVLYTACEALRIGAVLLSPVMPNRTLILLEVLNSDKNLAGIHHSLSYALCSIGDNTNSIYHQKIAVSLDTNSIVFLQSLIYHLNYSSDMRAEEIFDYYKQFDQRFGLPHKDKWKPFAQPKVPKNKLKIGYVSPDFRDHAIMRFLLPILLSLIHI